MSKACPRVLYLRVEKDLRAEEALVPNVDGELLLGDGVDARVLFDPFAAVCVVLVKLFNKVRAHIAEPLLKTQHKIFGNTVRQMHMELNKQRRASCFKPLE